MKWIRTAVMQAWKNVICFKNTTGKFHRRILRGGLLLLTFLLLYQLETTDVRTVMISHVLFILRDGPCTVNSKDVHVCVCDTVCFLCLWLFVISSSSSISIYVCVVLVLYTVMCTYKQVYELR